MDEAIWVNLVTGVDNAEGTKSIWQLLLDASGVVQGVLLLLVLFSVVSWYIIGFKWLYLRHATRESKAFLDAFWASKRLDAVYQALNAYERSPISHVFKAGYVELTKLKSQDDGSQTSLSGALGGLENVERSLRRAATAEITKLESMIPFLATVGSTAPFVGLFGTVWGIMTAFMKINEMAQGQSLSIGVVAGPIAEALIATAIGLFAAIPAVIAYNYFINRIRVLSADMDNFSADFLNIIKRHFLK